MSNDTEMLNWLAIHLSKVSDTGSHIVMDWLDDKGNDFFSVLPRSSGDPLFRDLVQIAMDADAELKIMSDDEYDQMIEEHRVMRKVYCQ